MRLAPSYRTGRHYGAFMTIFVIALAFAVTAPLILPIAGVRSRGSGRSLCWCLSSV